MLQAVIFDMDGVIVDSHPIHQEAWRRLFERLGRPVAEEQLEFVRDGGKRTEIIRHFLGDLPPWQLEAYGRQKDAYFLKSAERLSLVAGLRGLVSDLRAGGIKLAVATSGCRKRAEYVLNRFALDSFFAAVVTGDDVGQGKPNPAIFLQACARVHSVPGTTLVMEDAAAGVRGAKTAGMKCLGIASPARSQLLYDAGADWVQPDFTGVKLSMLRALFGTPSVGPLSNSPVHSELEDGGTGRATGNN